MKKTKVQKTALPPIQLCSFFEWNKEHILTGFKQLSDTVAPLFEASCSGNLKLLKVALRDSENVWNLSQDKFRDSKGYTPLHLASACGSVPCVQLLIDLGADVNTCSEVQDNASPLVCAAQWGRLEVIKVLLGKGADVNAGYEHSRTALHMAVKDGSVDCVKVLLDAGALPNCSAFYCETPLHIAASSGNHECIKLLLEHEADFKSVKDIQTHDTALHLAAKQGMAECLYVLLKAGASPATKNSFGCTALHLAAAVNVDSVKTLLNAGADPNARDIKSRTPLHWAATSTSSDSIASECVKTLIEKGASVDSQDEHNFTPLHISAQVKKAKCAAVLLKNWSDPTLKSKKGKTALHFLIENIPDTMKYIKERFDSAVVIQKHHACHPECEIQVDFRAIIGGKWVKTTIEQEAANISSAILPEEAQREWCLENYVEEAKLLRHLVDVGNKDILSHPLSQAFLLAKWKRMAPLFMFSLLIQLLLTFLLTSYIEKVFILGCPFSPMGDQLVSTEPNFNSLPSKISYNSPDISTVFQLAPNGLESEPKANLDHDINTYYTPFTRKSRVRRYSSHTGKNTKAESNSNTAPSCSKKLFQGTSFTRKLLTVILIITMAKEIIEFVLNPSMYISNFENWVQLLLNIGVVLMLFGAMDTKLPLRNGHYILVACVLFLSWSLIMFQMTRFSRIGHYVDMLQKVTFDSLIVILAYSCLLYAFTLAFSVFLPGFSFTKLVTMMVGQVDLDVISQYQPKHANFPTMFYILYVAFVFLVTIILMNLLVGLAVHDIQGLEKVAKLNKSYRQLTFISRIESVLLSRCFQCLLLKPNDYSCFQLFFVSCSSNVPSWTQCFRPNVSAAKGMRNLLYIILSLFTGGITSWEVEQDLLQLATARQSASNEMSSTNNQHNDQCQTNNEILVSESNQVNISIEQRLDKIQNQIDTVISLLSELQLRPKLQ